MNVLYFSNADFDYQIGNIHTESLRYRVRNWYLWFLAACDEDDYLLVPSHAVDEKTVGEYRTYLKQFGLASGTVISEGTTVNVDRIVCFGYDGNARGYTASCAAASVVEPFFCDEPIVRHINNKLFCAGLLHKRGDTIRTVSQADLNTVLTHDGFPYVIRCPHGSSSNANVIVCNFAELDSAIACRRFEAIDRVSVERWYERTADYSAGFVIDESGQLQSFNLRRLYNSERGIFSMVRPLTGTETENTEVIWRSALATAQFLYGEIASLAYRGPVNFDFFTYRDSQQKETIKPFCDINARNTMALIGSIIASRVNAKDYALASFNARQLSDKGIAGYDEYICLSDSIYRRFAVRLMLVSPPVQKGTVTLLMYADRYFDEVAVRRAIEA